MSSNTSKLTVRAVLAASTAAAIGLSAVSASADEALADLVEEVAPSVVTVLSERDPVAPTNLRGRDSERFEEFFRNFGGPDRRREGLGGGDAPRSGLGSGFILDEDGWIVTNHHVVEGADRVTIRLTDDSEYPAEIIGTDPQTDLALLRIEAGRELPAVELGDSDDIRIGEDVMAVGNPFGLGGTVTSGIVSAKGRNISRGPYADFIQTDAAINRGNSGGPLFNMDGEVIGVNSAIYSPTGGNVGVGFAVTSNIVDQIITDLRDDGAVSRGWLGVGIQNVTPDLAAALGMDAASGALVSSVVEDSPAEGALQAGDVILSFGGEAVESSRDLPRLVAATASGASVDLNVLRDGEETTIALEIGTLETAEAEDAPAAVEDTTATQVLGATVEPLDDETRTRLGLDETVAGVVITSLSGEGAASRAGLRVGDVIVQLDSAEVTRPADLEGALEGSADDTALALVNRGGRQLFVALDLA